MTKSKTNPDHYQLGKIEIWDFIIDQDMGFLEGNVIKYICRAGNKPHETRLDDLHKAKAYIQKLIDTTYDYNSPRPDGSSDNFQENYEATLREFFRKEDEDPTWLNH